MIIYIHGFGSSGKGGKANLFREYFKEEIIAPSLSYVPNLAIDTLEQLIENALKHYKKVGIVGSSLGGYYAIYLSNKYNLKAVLINPAIYPYKNLNKTGIVTNYYDNSSFEVTSEHINSLKSFEIKEGLKQKNFLTLLQKNDEILDYNEAVEKLPNSELIIEDGGNHSFENIENYFQKISNFLN